MKVSDARPIRNDDVYLPVVYLPGALQFISTFVDFDDDKITKTITKAGKKDTW